MGSWSYVSLDALKRRLRDSLTTDDALYREHLEAAAEEVDRICHRTFRVHQETLYPDACRADELLLAEDVLAVVSLKTDLDLDGVYETTWDATDYRLLPADAPSRREPYYRFAAAPFLPKWFPTWGYDRLIELVVKAGYWEDLASNGTIAEDLDTSETGVDLTAGHGLEALQTILVDSEQMYITAFASTNTATVERAVNGTTAATHSSGAAVRRYRYPGPVAQAQAVLAEETLRPFGRTGEIDDTQGAARVQMPYFVPKVLEGFVKVLV